MDILWKVVGIGLCASVVGVLLRNRVPEMELMLIMASAFGILTLGMSLMPSIVSFLNDLGEAAHMEESIIGLLWKGAAITLLCCIASELCNGAGYRICAVSIEIVGKIYLLWEALPLLESAFQTIRDWTL